MPRGVYQRKSKSPIQKWATAMEANKKSKKPRKYPMQIKQQQIADLTAETGLAQREIVKLNAHVKTLEEEIERQRTAMEAQQQREISNQHAHNLNIEQCRVHLLKSLILEALCDK